MAELVMKDLVGKAGLSGRFHIGSAAVSREEIGSPVYPPARRELAKHGISCGGHSARQLTPQDYGEYDLLIGMDSGNLRAMHRICGGDPEGKMSLLMDHTARPGSVADPWYTDDFEATWRDVLEGCRGLLAELSGGALPSLTFSPALIFTAQKAGFNANFIVPPILLNQARPQKKRAGSGNY